MMHPSRQAYVEEAEDTDMGLTLENIPIDRNYAIPTGGGASTEQASALLEQFSRKRRAAAIAVPTDDNRVRARLRELKEPITLFGEGPADRRDRLRELLTRQAEGGGLEAGRHDVEMEEAPRAGEDQDEQNEEFYTEGSQDLLQARKDIARYSLPRTKTRVAFQMQESTINSRTHVNHRKAIKQRLQGFDLYGSQVAADRPISIARFSPSGEMIAAGNWGGSIKLLEVPTLEQKSNLRGHSDRVGGIAWYPGATLAGGNVSSGSVNLASGGAEGKIHLWSLESDTPISTLEGHSGRVCRVEFHPSGRYLASASFDTTWRLWDINTSTELLLQEGHSREVYTVSFNQEGSLMASAGLDSLARVWDLRTGRTIMLLDSHISPIYGLDWGVDGYRVLSGGGDGFVKCWDVRTVSEVGGIGAHKGGVTDLKWFKGNDGPLDGKELGRDAEKDEYIPKKAASFFVSCGFDKNVNVFSADDWVLCNTLSGHAGNVLSTDVTSDGKWIASSGHDRTVKLWARDDEMGI